MSTIKPSGWLGEILHDMDHALPVTRVHGAQVTERDTVNLP
ncbi:hypothetical protein NTE_03421 [Candidatus Nitrososphaera evergladensis SR1]|uniref:Uncharacterized protein n=1 Tax=Candidatus Nitrososphaera evergladensis SR1 TaxID=1459636 RepID=A0A075N1W6_9ARCH|nr:hypothetical protein NTE_03421 [Candidatus Nitrososphaera evergladensis SR1]